jgi:hypothetical protein
MASRVFAAVLLLSVLIMSTTSPAEACAIWCLGSHGGLPSHQHHGRETNSTQGHHHAGMKDIESSGTSPHFVPHICKTDCYRATLAVPGKSLPREKSEQGLSQAVVGKDELRVTQSDRSAMMHFEVAGPLSLASIRGAVLRV